METIKSKLDLLFSLKMNVFHWHLTEGLGWRLEIKKYPELTKTGAYVGKGPEQQGYYTQEQVRELVSYAAERNITIVPEIDIPGHAEAALYAYPEYGCFSEQAKIPETGFTDCKKRMEGNGLRDSHELQLWLSAQMASYLKTKGRKALEKGYPVICSPNYYMYLNFPETPWRGYGKERTFSLEDAYLRNPADRVLSEDNPQTLGMECALWTDFGLTEDMLDSRLFPRIYAIAELMWRGQSGQ